MPLIPLVTSPHRRHDEVRSQPSTEAPGFPRGRDWTPLIGAQPAAGLPRGRGKSCCCKTATARPPPHPWPAYASLTLAGNASADTGVAWVGSARTLRLRSLPLPWAGSPRLAAQSGREPGTATCRGVPDAPFHLAGGARRGRRDSPSRTALVGAEAQLPRLRVEERRASRLAARPKEFRAFTKVSTKVFSFDSFSVDQGHYRDCGTGATLENPGPVIGDAPAEFERNQSHPQDRQAGVGRPVARAGLILLPEFVAHPVAGSRSRLSSPECIVRRTSAGPGRRPLGK